MFTCRRHFLLRALGEGSDPGPKIAAIPQRVELHAEYCARREAAYRYALSGNSGGAGHLDAPRDRFSIASTERLSIRSERHKMDLGMIGLSDKSSQDPRQGDGLRLIVHRKRVVGHRRCDKQTQRWNCKECGNRAEFT